MCIVYTSNDNTEQSARVDGPFEVACGIGDGHNKILKLVLVICNLRIIPHTADTRWCDQMIPHGQHEMGNRIEAVVLRKLPEFVAVGLEPSKSKFLNFRPFE